MSNVAAGKDTDDEGEKLNDVEKALGKMGIQLRSSIGEWRNFEEVLDEVADKWEHFSEVQRSQIATAIAGTRQQETFRALMNNYDEVFRLTGVAADSAGSATERMNIYLESVEAKTNELKATWEEFVMSLSQSESYKSFLDFCIWLIQNLPSVIGYITSLILLFKGNTIVKRITELFGATGKLKTKLNELKMDFNIVRTGAYRTADGIYTVATAEQTAAATTSMLTLGLSALIAVISLGVQAYNSWKQANVEAAQKASEEAEGYEKKAQAMDDAIVKYQEIYNSGDDYNTKQEQLKQLSTELTDAYGKEANALDLLNGSYENNIKAMEEAAKEKRRQELSNLKVASDKGESNLDNWINFGNIGDASVKGNISSQDKQKVMDTIYGIAGDKIRYTTSKAAYNGYQKREEVKDYDIKGIEFDYTISNEQAHKYAQDIREYVEKNMDSLSQETRDTLTALASQLVHEADKDAEEQFKNKQKYQLAKLTINDDGSYRQEIQDYEAQLKKQKDLEEKYNNETNEEKKEAIKKELAEEYELTDKALQKVKDLYNSGDSNQSTLSEKVLLDYLGYSDNSSAKTSQNVYTGLRQIGKTDEYEKIRQELKDTGALSEDARKKLVELKEELYKQENGKNFVEALNDDLGGIANKSKINLDKNNLLTEYNKTQKDSDIQGKKNEAADILQDLSSYELGYTDQYLEKAGGHLTKIGDAVDADREKLKQLQDDIKKLEEEEKTNISNWLNGINALLTDLGLNVNAKWYKDLSESLKNGKIDFETFYNTIATNCEKIGIDLNDLKKAFSSVAEELGMLGSQQQFLSEMGKIEDLYEKATKLKSGKSLEADKIVELRNEYKEVNDYIAETGDLTLKNGQLLMELGDEAYEKGENALEKQIETLEDYQDAILNTVDAMGIMAEFKEELAKLDSELAETITDNAIAEAKAEGMYVDFTKEAADGVYEAKETVAMANQNLYSSEQASIQGILDSKAIEAETEQAYADQTLAIDEAIQASDAATAEQKANSAQWIIDSKTTEGEVTAGVAEVEATSESSSAQASAEGANSKADSQAVAAQAAITTGQAFIQMARAIAEAEGIEASGLDEAAGKLEGLQGRLNEIGEEKASNAQKAAAAYAEAQNKIKEAKARLGSYRGLNTQGHGGYNKAGGSGGSKGSGSKGSGSKNNYTTEDAAEDLKGILNDIEDYERDIEADLEDQTEELINHYNLQRNKLDLLKEELDYYDDIYDSVEDTTKWLNNQLNILDEESKKVAELQNSSEKIMAQRDKIYKENSGYNVASWFDEAMNETLAYGDLINSFEYRKEAIQKETAKKMRDVYNSVSGSTDKDTISDAKKKIKNIEDEADLKIKELDKEKEKVENIYDSVEKLNDAWKENQEAIRDSLQELNNRIKETRDELIDQMMEQLERAVDRMNNSIEKDATRLEQLKDVQESYNDILNDTIETQQELEDELKSNMDTYQYLDDTMRQLMFNEDDYKQLSKVLEGVQEDIADIWQDHYDQISSLTDDEMYKAEYITNETERQLAAKQKEYDLAKAELDVAKAQTNLQNTLNERNTRVWNARTNSYEWVANPDAVKEARQQVADAEREKTRLEREAEQQKLLDQLDRFIDADNLQIDENNEYLERIQEAIEQETEEVKSIEEALNNIKDTNLPAINTVLVGALGEDGGTMTALLKNINKSQSELAAALRGQTIEQAVNQLKSGSMKKDEFNELVKRLGYSFNETTGMITTQDGTFAAHYSGWTKKSNADKQLTTAPNGVQVTGNQNSSSTTSIASANARAQNNNLEQIAKEVWLGKWGNGADRKRRLEAAGYSYKDVQALVNKGYNYFFDKGGVATGVGFLPKDTQLPERVLSPRQTKAFENLVANLTSNPVLSALSKVPSISSKFEGLSGETNNSKNYYFRDFTVKADDIEQFISSIETMMPMKK